MSRTSQCLALSFLIVACGRPAEPVEPAPVESGGGGEAAEPSPPPDPAEDETAADPLPESVVDGFAPGMREEGEGEDLRVVLDLVVGRAPIRFSAPVASALPFVEVVPVVRAEGRCRGGEVRVIGGDEAASSEAFPTADGEQGARIYLGDLDAAEDAEALELMICGLEEPAVLRGDQLAALKRLVAAVQGKREATDAGGIRVRPGMREGSPVVTAPLSATVSLELRAPAEGADQPTAVLRVTTDRPVPQTCPLQIRAGRYRSRVAPVEASGTRLTYVLEPEAFTELARARRVRLRACQGALDPGQELGPTIARLQDALDSLVSEPEPVPAPLDEATETDATSEAAPEPTPEQ